MESNNPEIEKIYLTAESLFEDSCKLAASVLASGFRPKYLIALWRGGTPIGICTQEMLAYYGIHTDHIAVRTSLYTGIEKPLVMASFQTEFLASYPEFFKRLSTRLREFYT